MLTYRPAVEDDFAFLWHLHSYELRPHIENTQTELPWIWDEAGQRQVLRALFEPACTLVILVKGHPAGALQVYQERHRLVLDYIAIASRYQGCGLGTTVLKHLQQHAHHLNLPVELQVLKDNPAVRLYRRLGFEVMRLTTCTYWMRWEPPGWLDRENHLEPVGYFQDR